MAETVYLDASHAIDQLGRTLDIFTDNLAGTLADATKEQPTLRDRFAMAAPSMPESLGIGLAQALAGLPPKSDFPATKEQLLAELEWRARLECSWRYSWADAMLVARGPKRIPDSEFEEVSP